MTNIIDIDRTMSDSHFVVEYTDEFSSSREQEFFSSYMEALEHALFIAKCCMERGNPDHRLKEIVCHVSDCSANYKRMY